MEVGKRSRGEEIRSRQKNKAGRERRRREEVTLFGEELEEVRGAKNMREA